MSNQNKEKIIDIKDIFLPGRHNLENVCAAITAGILAGVKRTNIVKVLKTFKGLAHRLELVADIKGIRYYDDSFSTTPETAIAAIQSFKNNEILILGGSSKGSDFSQLGQVINNVDNIKAIIGIGTEWPRIKACINHPEKHMLIVEGAENMQQIIQAAVKIAQAGEIVLLSPACASFDMFKNYKERGKQFRQAVEKLLHDSR